jgi:hypothetical protein
LPLPLDTYEQDPRISEINHIQAKSVDAPPPVFVHKRIEVLSDEDTDDGEGDDSEDGNEEREEPEDEKEADVEDEDDTSGGEAELPEGNKVSTPETVTYRNKFALLNDDDDDDD